MSAVSDTAGTAPPGPHPDIESEPFWEALRNHRLSLQRCPACGRLRFPPMPGCPYCGSDRAAAWVDVPGRGRVYSYVRVHRALTSAMVGATPYVVAVVELDEGPRLVGRLGAGADVVDIDDRVAAIFVDRGSWTELRWNVTSGRDVAQAGLR